MTSLNNPLQVAEIPAGTGIIGIGFAPGKWQVSGVSGHHERDLATDLDAIADWGASVVVTLVERHELDALLIPHIGDLTRARGMTWEHWPIRDGSVPDAAFMEHWPERSLGLRCRLADGQHIYVHCKGGLGRAGSVAARLLVENGESAKRAIWTVRRARPGAVERVVQEKWVAAGRQYRRGFSRPDVARRNADRAGQ